MRSELSKKNEHHIPAFRFLELRNWVRQYPDWVKERNNLLYLKASALTEIKGNEKTDFTGDLAVRLAALENKIGLVNDLCWEVWQPLRNESKLFLDAIINGKSWGNMVIYTCCPARNEWYKCYRKFFYLLDQKRD